MTDKRLYTRKEAAVYCGISYDKILRAIRNNILPARRYGRDVLLDRADLDTFIENEMGVA